jgi:hypothetical protein
MHFWTLKCTSSRLCNLTSEVQKLFFHLNPQIAEDCYSCFLKLTAPTGHPTVLWTQNNILIFRIRIRLLSILRTDRARSCSWSGSRPALGYFLNMHIVKLTILFLCLKKFLRTFKEMNSLTVIKRNLLV